MLKGPGKLISINFKGKANRPISPTNQSRRHQKNRRNIPNPWKRSARRTKKRTFSRLHRTKSLLQRWNHPRNLTVKKRTATTRGHPKVSLTRSWKPTPKMSFLWRSINTTDTNANLQRSSQPKQSLDRSTKFVAHLLGGSNISVGLLCRESWIWIPNE